MTLGIDFKKESVSDSPPMDSPWPMYCHDVRHTGRSSGDTIDNPGDEKWRFKTSFINEAGGPVIDDNGTIYFGNNNGFLYALNPNGTMKWKYDTNGWIASVPAIAKDGTIYIGSYRVGLHAIYPNGKRKWLFCVDGNAISSPTIAEDDTIYFGCENHKVYAVNPDGSEKWNYSTGVDIESSPAIAGDGTIYIGCDDSCLYALYPNGTLRWRFKLEGNYTFIRGDPSIAEDGTIYIGPCSLSGDNHSLYALNPNGTMKWKYDFPYGYDDIESCASIAEDGTIYIGTSKLYAIYPNGTKKWSFNLGGSTRIIHSSPAIGAAGTIYIGTSIHATGGGDFIAINPDGTEKWRKLIAERDVQSSPAIGKDGTVYIASSSYSQFWGSYGYLHAFGIGNFKVDINGPYIGGANKPIQFIGEAWNGTEPYSWFWDFSDGHTSEEQNPLHTYTAKGDYIVTLNVTDATGKKSGDITRVKVNINHYPYEPEIDGPTNGKARVLYNYTFVSIDPDGDDIIYHVWWGDMFSEDAGPFPSGEEITLSHYWIRSGTYNIHACVEDIGGLFSFETIFKVSIPRTRTLSYHWLFERFPILERLLRLIKSNF